MYLKESLLPRDLPLHLQLLRKGNPEDPLHQLIICRRPLYNPPRESLSNTSSLLLKLAENFFLRSRYFFKYQGYITT